MIMKETTEPTVLDARPETLKDRIHSTNKRKPFISILVAIVEHAKTVRVLGRFEAIDHDERRKRKKGIAIGLVHV